MLHFVRAPGAHDKCRFCLRATNVTWYWQSPAGGTDLPKACDICIRQLCAAAETPTGRRERVRERVGE